MWAVRLLLLSFRIPVVYLGRRVTCSAIKRKQTRKRFTKQCVKIKVTALVTILVSRCRPSPSLISFSEKKLSPLRHIVPKTISVTWQNLIIAVSYKCQQELWDGEVITAKRVILPVRKSMLIKIVFLFRKVPKKMLHSAASEPISLFVKADQNVYKTANTADCQNEGFDY